VPAQRWLPTRATRISIIQRQEEGCQPATWQVRALGASSCLLSTLARHLSVTCLIHALPTCRQSVPRAQSPAPLPVLYPCQLPHPAVGARPPAPCPWTAPPARLICLPACLPAAALLPSHRSSRDAQYGTMPFILRLCPRRVLSLIPAASFFVKPAMCGPPMATAPLWCVTYPFHALYHFFSPNTQLHTDAPTGARLHGAPQHMRNHPLHYPAPPQLAATCLEWRTPTVL